MLVIFASGLKYAGVGSTQLGWILVIVIALVAAGWLLLIRPGRQASALAATDQET
jgi:hypothetical protein